MQVIGLEDVERLLGKRPFSSQEMRNIDRYRHGAGGKPPTPPAATEEAPKAAEPEGSDGPGGSGGDGGEPAFHRRVEPGVVVAT